MKKINPASLSALLSGDIENAIIAATPGGIEAQEKRGQNTFVNSSSLPKNMLHGCTREKLEKMGIVFGEDEDDIFISVTLPEGWKKQATEHSMWSDLIDDKGRKRAAIFYKAAFYDRNAHIWLVKRYGFNLYAEGDCANESKSVITDCEKPIHTIGSRKNDDYDINNEHNELAKQWLDEHFPEWNDEMAYWD